MDRRAFGLGALSLALAGAARADQETVDQVLERLRGQTRAPALAGMVVTADATPFIGAAGVRRAGSADRVSVRDRWHLGSNTKAMTAAVYGRLVEKGEAKWGAKLPELFPDLRLHGAWRDTTIEALMGHRAGLVDAGLTDAAWAPHLVARRTVVEQRTELAGRALAVPPKGTVGAFAYANANYILAGAAIERITGRAWEDVMRAELWKPLGIATGGFGPPQAPDDPWGHGQAFFGSPTAGPRPVNPNEEGSDNPPAVGPAGTAHMAMADYAKWLRLFITDGGGVLKPETIQKLSTPVPGEGPPPYALGWGVIERDGDTLLVHSGSNTLWFCTAAISLKRKMAFATFSNDAAADGGQKANQLLSQEFKRLYPA